MNVLAEYRRLSDGAKRPSLESGFRAKAASRKRGSGSAGGGAGQSGGGGECQHARHCVRRHKRRVDRSRKRDEAWTAATRQCENAADVDFEAMWRLCEAKAELKVREDLSRDPGDSSAPVTRGLWSRFQQMDDETLAKFKEYLENGVSINLWYCWLALERFRNNQQDQDRETLRREARLIEEVFCRPGGSLFVPVGKSLQSVIDRMLWTTPDHVCVGNNVFQGMQSKLMVELERYVLLAFVEDEATQTYCKETCCTIVPPCTLADVLALQRTRSVLIDFLGDAGEHLSFVVDLKARADHIKPQALREEVIAFIESCEELGAFSNRFLGLEDPAEMLEAVYQHFFYQARDRGFSEFARSPGYIKCWSTLSGIPADALVDTLCRAGPSSPATSLPAPSSSPSSWFTKLRKRKKSKAQRIYMAPPPSAEEVRTSANVSATPRDFKYAFRACCESTDRNLGGAFISQNPDLLRVRTKLVLGLEGVFRDNHLQELLRKFLRANLLPTGASGANLLKLFAVCRSSAKDLSPEQASEAKAIIGDVLDMDNQEAEAIEDVRNACTNLLLQKYFRPFQDLVKLSFL